MRILVVCHRIPFPPNRGGKIRPFHMISHLAERHSVTVASLAHTEEEFRQANGLTNYCEEVIGEVVPARMRWAHAVAALPSRRPSSAHYFWSEQLKQRIDAAAAQKRFDRILVHCAFVARYVVDLEADFKVLDFGDIDSCKWADYSRERRKPLAYGYALEARKLRRLECQLADRFDACTVTTRSELDEYATFGSRTSCAVVPNGVDTSYFRPKSQDRKERPVLVFLGRMDYFPNVDGIVWFAEQVFPRIRRARPDVQLRIVGADPAAAVRRLAGPGVTVTGYVADVRPHLADASVAVAPLRIARGTQNKILETMSFGIPVVSTVQAAKGIQAQPGRHLLVAKDAAEFAADVIQLLDDHQLRRRLAADARAEVLPVHNWDASMKVLDSVLHLDGTACPSHDDCVSTVLI